MLEIKFLRENPDVVKAGLRKRNYDENALKIVDETIAIDTERRQSQTSLDRLLAESNQSAKLIGNLYREGKREEADKLKVEVAAAKSKIKELEAQLNEAEAALENALLSIPNLPHELVPFGKGEAENEIFQDWTKPLPELGDDAMAHWDLAKKYNIIDFGLGAKISGSGFALFRGKGAKLERALINFFLDEADKAGYEEIIPPLLVNEASARGTGQIPDKEGQMYYAEKDDLYLIPTAEVPITNIYRDVILDSEDFSIKMTGYTPCFRREAGAHGSEVRGLNRVHQFDKVEIVRIEHPNNSYKVLDEMLDHVRGLLEKLELPYRILRLCGGDTGFTSALTYDFEVYSAAQKRWLEVSSVSNFETYQANRLKLRFRDADGKRHLAHTLNGSALALARIVAALLENNQTEDGILIPKALIPFTRFEKIG